MLRRMPAIAAAWRCMDTRRPRPDPVGRGSRLADATLLLAIGSPRRLLCSSSRLLAPSIQATRGSRDAPFTYAFALVRRPAPSTSGRRRARFPGSQDHPSNPLMDDSNKQLAPTGRKTVAGARGLAPAFPDVRRLPA